MDRLIDRRRRGRGRVLLGAALGVLVLAATVACTRVSDGVPGPGAADQREAAASPERADRGDHADRARRLAAACAWAPVLGGTELDRAGGFDVVVVDAVAQRDGYVETAREDVRALQADGALVLAYLSVGTVERWRHYAAGVPRSWTLGAVDGWPGSASSTRGRRAGVR